MSKEKQSPKAAFCEDVKNFNKEGDTSKEAYLKFRAKWVKKYTSKRGETIVCKLDSNKAQRAIQLANAVAAADEQLNDIFDLL